MSMWDTLMMQLVSPIRQRGSSGAARISPY